MPVPLMWPAPTISQVQTRDNVITKMIKNMVVIEPYLTYLLKEMSSILNALITASAELLVSALSHKTATSHAANNPTQTTSTSTGVVYNFRPPQSVAGPTMTKAPQNGR